MQVSTGSFNQIPSALDLASRSSQTDEINGILSEHSLKVTFTWL